MCNLTCHKYYLGDISQTGWQPALKNDSLSFSLTGPTSPCYNNTTIRNTNTRWYTQSQCVNPAIHEAEQTCELLGPLSHHSPSLFYKYRHIHCIAPMHSTNRLTYLLTKYWNSSGDISSYAWPSSEVQCHMWSKWLPFVSARSWIPGKECDVSLWLHWHTYVSSSKEITATMTQINNIDSRINTIDVSAAPFQQFTVHTRHRKSQCQCRQKPMVRVVRRSVATRRLELLRAIHIRRVVKLTGSHPLPPPDLRQLAPWFVQISGVFGVCLYTAVSEPAVYTMAA